MRRARRGESLSDLAKRIVESAERSGDCMLWTGRSHRGFGAVSANRCIRAELGLALGKVYAHRAVFAAAHGPIDRRSRVAHTCGNRLCVNIDHLALAPRTGPRVGYRPQRSHKDHVEHVRARLQRRTARSGDCVEWLGARLPSRKYGKGFGYGILGLTSAQAEALGLPPPKAGSWVRQVYTHRLSFLLNKGEIPAGMSVLHSCDNPPCINPDHLFLGTPADNTLDMLRKGRGRCSLSSSDVRVARDLFARGIALEEIAARLGTTKGVVFNAATGQTYAHLGLDPVDRSVKKRAAELRSKHRERRRAVAHRQFGRIVEHVRDVWHAKKGWQRAAAELIGSDEFTICRFLAGRQRVGPRLARRAAEHMGLSTAFADSDLTVAEWLAQREQKGAA